MNTCIIFINPFSHNFGTIKEKLKKKKSEKEKPDQVGNIERRFRERISVAMKKRRILSNNTMFEDLATELVFQILVSCSSIQDAHALSSTCKRFHHIYASSQKLLILERVAETQYGPLKDAIQLVTHNASQPAHIRRNALFSLALLQQIVQVGSVAQQWVDIYPLKKWKDNFEDRRLLTTGERRRFRCALYRLWLYSRAFHNRRHPRETRMQKLVVTERAALLHNWSTNELAEMADVHTVLQQVVSANVCPSDGTVARKFRKRITDLEAHQLLFNMQHLGIYNNNSHHDNGIPRTQRSRGNDSAVWPVTQIPGRHHHHPNQSHDLPSYVTSRHAYAYDKYAPSRHHDPGLEGWGDDINHYYVVQDMLKLDPAQILWLKEEAPLKRQIELYVRSLGESGDYAENHTDSGFGGIGTGHGSRGVCHAGGTWDSWFENNGETWVQTLEWVLNERGEDGVAFWEGLEEGKTGIAVNVE